MALLSRTTFSRRIEPDLTEELDSGTYAEVTRLCARGDELVGSDELAEAVRQYEQALSLLPPPFYRWKAATWVLTALGETLYFQRDYPAARRALQDALLCPDAATNPLIHLRLGQALYDLLEMEAARQELLGAYMLDGERVFRGEDPKYWNYLRSSVDHVRPDRL